MPLTVQCLNTRHIMVGCGEIMGPLVVFVVERHYPLDHRLRGYDAVCDTPKIKRETYLCDEFGAVRCIQRIAFIQFADMCEEISLARAGWRNIYDDTMALIPFGLNTTTPFRLIPSLAHTPVPRPRGEYMSWPVRCKSVFFFLGHENGADGIHERLFSGDSHERPLHRIEKDFIFLLTEYADVHISN